MDPGPIFIILLLPVYFTRTIYFTRILLLFSTRYTHNLCFKQTGEIDNFIVSWKQSICLCVYRFHVAASTQSLDEAPYINCPKLSQTSKHHLQSFVSPLQDRHTLISWLRENLAAILITPSSWGFQWAGHSTRHQLFSGAIIPAIKLFSGVVAGRKKTYARGVFARTSFTLFYCFALLYFILLASFYIKNPKKN
jgi:hypothetical protein